jgi:transposase
MLEDSGIKLSAVATDIVGVSGRLMLEARIAGNTDPAAMADPPAIACEPRFPS